MGRNMKKITLAQKFDEKHLIQQLRNGLHAKILKH